jgi:ATP-binding cassette subfamily B protein
VIRSFGRADFSNRNFERRTGTLFDTSMEKVRLSARFWTFLEIIPNLSLVAVLLLGALAVGEGAITAGTLVAFIILMLSLVWPIAALGVILAMAQEAMTAADRVMELFDTPSTIVGGERILAEPRGHLRFDHVDFGFPDSDELVLRDVNLEVLPGETVAVVGATGSGKTALTGLVPRLYDVRSGRVTVDGVDVRELTLDNLRSIVATAFEEPTLFSMSARENLTLGRPDASDDDVERAIDTAQAGFVRELPWGLDTRIGEQGMSLSGGQRQRLALARAVLAQPRILVLDDTLSALDVHTEALVEQALRRVLAQATGIVVAHRASTVLLADKVALLQDGTITHVGKHTDLLATVPAYRDLLGGDDEDELITVDGQAVSS